MTPTAPAHAPSLLLAAIALACLGAAPPTAPAAAPATAPATRPATAPAAGPTLVTLRLKDAPPKALAAELARQGPLTVRLIDEEELPPVTLQLVAQPYWVAVREACRQLRLGPSPTGILGAMALSPDPSFSRRPVAVAGPLLLTADSLESVRSVHASGRQRAHTFELTFTGYVDPAIPILGYHPRVTLTEVTDDRGNSLAPTFVPNFPGDEVTGGDDDDPAPWLIDFTVPLVYPAKDPGRRIERLRGEVTLYVASRTEAWELRDPLKARDETRTFGRRRFAVNRVRRSTDSVDVTVTVHRDGFADAEWARFRRLALAPTVRLADAQGRPLFFQGTEEAEVLDRRLRRTFVFTAQDPDGQRNAGPVARLVWNVPVEVEPMTIPFEFKGLPMP